YQTPKAFDVSNNSPKAEILKTILYADYSLKHFFNMAQKQPWFVNTLFVITADHTAISEQATFNNSLGRYRIPLVFYEPNNVKPKIDERVCQQLDIFPTILSYLGIGDVVVTFGNNLLENNIKTFAIQYVNNQHQFIEDSL